MEYSSVALFPVWNSLKTASAQTQLLKRYQLQPRVCQFDLKVNFETFKSNPTQQNWTGSRKFKGAPEHKIKFKRKKHQTKPQDEHKSRTQQTHARHLPVRNLIWVVEVTAVDVLELARGVHPEVVADGGHTDEAVVVGGRHEVGDVTGVADHELEPRKDLSDRAGYTEREGFVKQCLFAGTQTQGYR